MSVKANLSDTRGNRLGFLFFRIFMRVFGHVHACRFVAVPAFFYALFDNEAFSAARDYLSSRFPGDSAMMLRWRFFRQIMSVGSSMVLQHALRSGREVPRTENFGPGAREALEDGSRGAILLLSHVGCWQAALPFVGTFGKRVNLLVQANANANIAAMFAAENVSVIDNSAMFGGLLECVAALERGEIVSIMGDRAAGGERDMETSVFGRTFRIPRSPWTLAARLGVAVVPVFPVIKGGNRAVEMNFLKPITVGADPGRRPEESDFARAAGEYAAAFEMIATRYPYQIYLYSKNNSSESKEEKNG